MANIIVTILERLKIIAPFRNEKADYFLMHDKDSGEVCAVPEAAILSKINNRIDGIIYPDGFTKTGTIVRVGNDVSIAANDFKWRINLNPYTNAIAFNQILDSTESPELKRVDTLAATTDGTIVYYKGEEDEFILQPTQLPTDQLRLTDITVFGDVIEEHTEPIITEVFTKEEKDKLALLDPTSDIDKPVSTAQAAADAAVLEAANSYADAGLELKLNAADYNDRYKGKYTSLVNLETAHPTANAGDYAQVDAGLGSDVINYNWDAEEGWVIGSSSGSGATNTDELPEGSSNLYFTTARVLATVLTGISFATGGAIVSTDSVLVAFGKIQKQLNDGFTGSNIRSLLGITTLSGSNTGDQDLSGYAKKYGTRTVLSGTSIDWSSDTDTYTKTLTANTALTDTNLPSGTNTRTITLSVDGAYTLTVPSYWKLKGGVYDTSKVNQIVLQCVNGNSGSERVNYIINPDL